MIVVGCLVVGESSIATGSLSNCDKRSSRSRLNIIDHFSVWVFFLLLLLLSDATTVPLQSDPFTWTDKDDAFEMSCSSWWNQQAAAADM